MAEDTVPMINDIVDEHSTLLPQPIKKPTPLPKVQISVLLLLQLAEPITSQCILPFITQVSDADNRNELLTNRAPASLSGS